MKLQEMLESHQHPAPGAPSVGSTHDHGVVHLLDDGDEIITLQLRERQRERERERKNGVIRKSGINVYGNVTSLNLKIVVCVGGWGWGACV